MALSKRYEEDQTVASKLRSLSDWINNFNGNDSTGFNAYPAGMRYITGFDGGSTTYLFLNKGRASLFWPSYSHYYSNPKTAAMLAVHENIVGVYWINANYL